MRSGLIRLGGLFFAPLLFLVTLVSMLACHRQMTADELRVVAAVKEYNLLLPRAYGARKAGLVICATDNERERLSMLIEGLEQKGWTLDSRQETFEVGTVTIYEPQTLADLDCTETWWYRQLDSKTGKDAQAPKRIRYNLRYKLVQREGHWLVDRIELLKSEDLPTP